MNKTKKSLISVLLAFIMLATCFAAFGLLTSNSANALTDEYDGEDYAIYYFADSYSPSLDESTLLSTYSESNRKIVYDLRSGLTSAELSYLIDSGYFDDFGGSCMVIIEITGELIDSGTLFNLFTKLKDQGCTVIFVTTYSKSAFDDNVLQYVDGFMQISSDGVYYDFIVNSVEDMYLNGLSDTSCILVDSRLINVSNYDGNFTALCTGSPNLTTLLQCLCDKLGTTANNYNDMKDEYHANGFQLLVHVDSDRYIDLFADYDTSTTLDGNVICLNFYEDVVALGASEYFAMGIWYLTNEFYYLLKDLQKNKVSFILYVYEDDPISYSSDGLYIVTDTELSDTYGSGKKNTNNPTSLLWLISSLD